MTLLDSLLDAIVRLDGDSLVMHVGEKPYVVTTSTVMSSLRGPLSWGQVELSSRPLTPDTVLGMLGQILPKDQRRLLDEMGAIEYELESPIGNGRPFIVTAARGGDDVWVEVRRKPVPVAEPVPDPAGLAEAPAVEAPVVAGPAVEMAVADEEVPVEMPAVEMPVVAPEPPEQVPVEAPAIHAISEAAEAVVDEGEDVHEIEMSSDFKWVSDEAPTERLPAVAEAEPVFHLVEEEPTIEFLDVGDEEPAVEVVDEDAASWDEIHFPSALAPVAVPEPVVASEPETEVVADSEPEVFAIKPEPEFVAVEPEPEVVAIEPEPEVVAIEPEPEVVAIEPEPEVVAIEPEPVVVAIEPEPEVVAVEPEPEIVAVEPEPEVVAIEPEPEVVAIEPEPEVVAIEPEPEIVAVEPEPEVVAIEPEPEVVAIEPEPEVVAVEPEPEVVAIEPEPEVVAIEPEPEVVAIEPEPAPVIVPMAKPALKLQPALPAPLAPAASTEASLVALLKVASARGASTLYAVADSRPMVRIDGEVALLGIEASVTAGEVDRFAFEFAPRDQVAEPTSEWACAVKGVGRVRCVTFHDDSGTGLIFHLPAPNVSTADELGLSARIQSLCGEADGLVVIAGPRGNGKSTLLDAFVDLINRTRNDHVITIESHIKTTHEKRHSFISQRQSAPDGEAIAAAARAALREGPDVLVIEDLRAPEALSVALDAARAGRLVFGGISAPTASIAVERLIGAYPADRRPQVRALLAGTLRAVVAQTLVRKQAGGRIGARELLLNSPAVEKLILDGAVAQLPIAIDGGRRLGMVTMNDALGGLVRDGVVDVIEACRAAPDRASLIAALERDGIDVSQVERWA